MGLKQIKFPEAKVELPGDDSFVVRGLSLNDIAILVQRHGKRLSELFTQFSQQNELTTDAVAAFALPLIQTAPEIVAELIACASGDPDDAELAAQLPFPVQIDALEKLARLTFEAGGGPKKLVETVIRLAQGTTSLLESLKT